MRILKKKIFHNQGFVHLKCEEEDDLWYLYNLIQPGDNIKTLTYRQFLIIRKIKFTSKTGSVSNQVLKVDYLDNEDMIQLEIKGRCVVENQYINMGQHHTFKIDIRNNLSIFKQFWDHFQYKILKEAVEETEKSDIKVLIMDEGVAHLCYQRQNTFRIRRKVEMNIPKKRMMGNDQHDKKIQKFYDECFQMLFNIDHEVTKCIIIASPGFVKDQFKTYCSNMAMKEQFHEFKKVISKFILVHSANGFVNCLTDILQEPSIQQQLINTKALDELYEQFQKTLEKDEDRIHYTAKYVIEASMHDAIKNLMITDTLFRTRNFSQRKVYNDVIQHNQLCERVKQKGGMVTIFSGKLYTGEKLDQLGGVAAILNFPLNLDYLDDKEDLNEESIASDDEEYYKVPDMSNEVFMDFMGEM